jgi:FkbM family methyltransferase
MPFISYAQNYEDVMLRRALREVERGFYVDIGAADPKEDSVTFAFYERGWSGINVEPLDEYFAKLVQARPRDKSLKVAAGRETGVRTLYALPSGLSTLDAELSARHQASGLPAQEIVVPVLTLTTILEDCGLPTIHFLKIDVEGAEAEVLEGLDLDRRRPWIIVVEATEPYSQLATRDNWEHLITNHGYDFAYFDGLNCFYVADERPELKARLATPPNVFDDFVRSSEWSNAKKAVTLAQELVSARREAQQLDSVLRDVQKELETTRPESSYLRNALQAEKNYTDHLYYALKSAREQVANLHNALLMEQAQVANLSTVPSVDRAIGRTLMRLRDKGYQLSGGGIRALAKRAETAWLRWHHSFSVSHPRLAVLGRRMLTPFLNGRTPLFRHSAVPDIAIVQAGGAETTIDLVPDQFRRVEVRFTDHKGENIIRFETDVDGVKPESQSRTLFFNVRILQPEVTDPTNTFKLLNGFSQLEMDGKIPHAWTIARRANLQVRRIPPGLDSVVYVFELSALNTRCITVSQIADAESLSHTDSEIAIALPVSARDKYLKLQAGLTENGTRSRTR